MKVPPTCKGPPESPWQESWPPVSWPAHKNISGINSCRPARKNIILHRSLLTMGTWTSWSTEGSVPPSDSRPHPVTRKIVHSIIIESRNNFDNGNLPVALRPIRRSSVPGKQIGAIWGANSRGWSNWTRAKSNSYVKKLYFGWTTFRATARSTYGNSSWMWEKSYSPTRIRICDVSKLKHNRNFNCYLHSLHHQCNNMFDGWTYSSTQCPAVAIQFSLMIAPPHRWVLENPKNEVLRTDTCQGHRPNGAFLPPTIRVSGLPIVDIPQSEKINPNIGMNLIWKERFQWINDHCGTLTSISGCW